MREQRLDFIDFTRGIAAVAVLLSHAAYSTGYFSKFGFGYEWLNLGQVGIIAFFIVSGFVIPLTLEHSQSILSFAIRRIFRIYPLFLLMLCTALFLHFVDTPYPEIIVSNYPATIFSNILLISEYTKYPGLVGNSWTLSIEVVWYVSFGLLFYCGIHKKPLMLSLFASGLFVGIACFSVISNLRLPLGRLGMIGVCLLGYYFYKWFYRQINKRDFLTCTLLLISSIFLLLWTSFSYHSAEGTTFRCVIISWVTGLLLFYIPFIHRAKSLFQLPIFMKLGEYSYSIYLVHPLVIFFCLRLIQGSEAQLFSMMFISLVLSGALFHLVEAPGIWAGKKVDRFLARQSQARYREKTT